MISRREFLGAAMGAAGWLALAGSVRSRTPATDELDAQAFRAARRYVATPFGEIASVERGSGPVALFLHGFPLNGFQWRGAITRLSRWRRCIAPDFLALGYTRVREGQAVGPDAQVAMLVSLLDTLGIDRVDLVASDSGGQVAQLLLVRHPNRVRTLLLTNCDTEPDSPPAAMQPVIELSRQGRYVDQWLAPWLRDKDLARSPEGIGGMCYSSRAHPTDEAIETYFAPLLSSPRRKARVHAYAIALARNALDGVEASLRRSRVPVRIVWGMADTIFAPDGAAYLDRVFGHSLGVRRLPEGKLFWPEERPDLIAEEAARLWQAHPADEARPD
jgi:pimeloyl-ACP methyl ester carboxylesterase